MGIGRMRWADADWEDADWEDADARMRIWRMRIGRMGWADGVGHGLLIEYGPVCHIVKLPISMIRPFSLVNILN